MLKANSKMTEINSFFNSNYFKVKLIKLPVKKQKLIDQIKKKKKKKTMQFPTVYERLTLYPKTQIDSK